MVQLTSIEAKPREEELYQQILGEGEQVHTASLVHALQVSVQGPI